MKKLIISSNTYSFLGYTAGMLMSEDSENSLYIINKDYRKMLYCKNLCKESVFIQRQYDIANIVDGMNITDINFHTSNNDESLKIQIQLNAVLKNVDEIYYPEWSVLEEVVSSVSDKLNIDSYKYKPISNYLQVKKYILDKSIYEKKINLVYKMVGINSKKEIKQLYKPIERFY